MKKILALIGLGVIVVMALTFASYIVLTKFRPEVEMRRMAIAMSGLTSFSHDDGFSWNQDGVTTTLYASGSLQTDEDNVLVHETSFRVVAIGQGDGYTDLSGEIKTIDGKTYLTYSAGGPTVPGVSFDDGTWVEFEEREIESWGEILPGLDSPLTLITPLSGWNSEAIGRLRYLLSLTDVVLVEYNGLSELIDSVNTRMIDGRFDQDATEASLLDFVRAKTGQEPQDADRILAHEQAQQLADLTLRFWIGTKDHLLYRVQAADELLDARIEFSAFNEPFDQDVPARVITFQEILSATLPESHGLARLSGGAQLVSESNARLPVTAIQESNDQDGDGLDDILEAFYGTDRSRADTDGDGVSDGDEVHAGDNPRGRGSLFSFGL
ncbi:hypothetical protein HZA87_05030 [Candidatus Uhrbacteria bacterium]|nr:hypothetical protein [Candidatus Uhrbacteria bacterium]